MQFPIKMRAVRRLLLQLAISGAALGFIVWHSHLTPMRTDVNINGLAPQWKWASYRKTIVVFSKHNCPYCEASGGVYKQLIDTAKSDPSLGLIFVTPDSREISTVDLPKLGGAASIFPETEISRYISATPTFITVDRTHSMRRIFVGVPTVEVVGSMLNGKND